MPSSILTRLGLNRIKHRSTPMVVLQEILLNGGKLRGLPAWPLPEDGEID